MSVQQAGNQTWGDETADELAAMHRDRGPFISGEEQLILDEIRELATSWGLGQVPIEIHPHQIVFRCSHVVILAALRVAYLKSLSAKATARIIQLAVDQQTD